MHHNPVSNQLQPWVAVSLWAWVVRHSNLGYRAAIDSKYKYSVREVHSTTELLWLAWTALFQLQMENPSF